jgi:hypothetical protein
MAHAKPNLEHVSAVCLGVVADLRFCSISGQKRALLRARDAFDALRTAWICR